MESLVNIFSYADPREWLIAVMNAKKTKEVKFSLRSFSRDLGYKNPSMLSEVLRGTRALKQDLADRICETLDLNQREREWLMLMIATRASGADPAVIQKLMAAATGTSDAAESKETLSLDQFRIIADWYHLAILEMLDLADFREDPAWIARRLNHRITPVQASLALDRLLRLGMISRIPGGKLTKTNDDVMIAMSGIPSAAIRSHHLAFLDLAKDAITKVPLERRSGYGTNLSIKRSDIAKIKQLIKKFHEELHGYHQKGDADDVYHINVQMFPLTEALPK